MKDVTIKYVTVTLSSAEKAYNWLVNHIDKVEVTAEPKGSVTFYKVQGNADLETENEFNKYMGIVHSLLMLEDIERLYPVKSVYEHDGRIYCDEGNQIIHSYSSVDSLLEHLNYMYS